MNEELRTELQKQQESMLEKLSAVMDTKVGQMKRELEEVANNCSSQYFIFRVLPFGLSTAPLVFTKILKPVLRHWRSSGKRVCMFLDDGLGGSSSLQSATIV
ncbi:Hypothetical predicted protein [Paramuricea clavata]|uniref:Reverse transcriptase domain-containing protein n=1 Tax=Paramuricea clavata TaxID=317549 RepID=A0A6S7GL44_PARCT|nr:Hypothetical predicted protein [Paramuricea clavata]